MTDLVVTSTQVLPVPSTGTDPTVTAFGIAGAAINAGQTSYLDTATGTYKLFDADLTTANTAAPVLAMTTAASGQPITVATGGSVTLGAGAGPTLGIIYIASGTAGGIAPAADLASNWRTTILGVDGASNTLKLMLGNSGKTKA